jgi:hypothetical protein
MPFRSVSSLFVVFFPYIHFTSTEVCDIAVARQVHVQEHRRRRRRKPSARISFKRLWLNSLVSLTLLPTPR